MSALLLKALCSAGEAPDSGALATAPDGALLLLLHSRAAQKATAVQLPADTLGVEPAKVGIPELPITAPIVPFSHHGRTGADQT